MKFNAFRSMRAGLFALALLAYTSVYAQAPVASKKVDLSKEIPFNPNVRRGVLDNGLTYYVEQNAKPADKVELRLVVNAGSILEDEDQRGLAHFMEHMNFNGTTHFKKNELVDYLQSIGVKFGADLNAYTSFDETVFILPIPSDDPDKLENGFQILEDWAHNALLKGEDIDDERGVVLEEYRLGRGADQRMSQKYLPKVLYGSKYADRLPIGTKENLENFKYESLRRFYKDWYRPDLMAVVAVGDLDADKLEALVKKHFAGIPMPENPKERKSYELPNHKKTLIAIESDKEAAFSRVQVMFKDTEDYQPETTLKDYRHSMVERLFSQMINNRLDELRNGENPPFVYGASYHGGTYARTKEAYQSFAMTSGTGQLRALKTLLEENQRVKEYGFYKGEFERAKKDLMSSMEKSYKDRDKTESNRLVGEFIRNYLEKEPAPGISWEYAFYQKELPSISLNEVNALISDYIKDENRVIVITGPDKEGIPKITEDQVREVMDSVENAKLEPYKDEAVATSLMTEMPKKGSIVKTTQDKELGTTTLTLSNGAKVTYKKTDFKNDEVLFSAFSYGGTSLYDLNDLKKAAFANGGLDEAGVNGFSKTDMSKMLSGKIVSVSPYISGTSEGFRGSASPKNLEEMFQLTHLYFTSLNKDDKAFNSYINKQKAFLGNLMSNPQFYYQIKLNDFIYGENPRYTGFPTPEKLDMADYDLAYKKYQERFAGAGDFHFYFVGNIDEAKLKEYCETYLASLPKGEKESYKTYDYRPLSGSHEKIIEKGQDQKSYVRIIFQGDAKYDPKEAQALKSLGDILTIKLIEKLREEEGGVYGVGASGSLQKTPYGWFRFTIAFPCGPKNVKMLEESALAEVKKLVDNGPTEKDLEKVKKTQIVEHKEDMQKNKYWLDQLQDADFEQEAPKALTDFDKSVNSMTTAELQKVAKKYLTGGYILGVQNPEKAE